MLITDNHTYCMIALNMYLYQNICDIARKVQFETYDDWGMMGMYILFFSVLKEFLYVQLQGQNGQNLKLKVL